MSSQSTETILKFHWVELAPREIGDPLPAQQHHHWVSLGRDEAKQEDVAAATVVTLQDCLTKGPILVQSYLFAFCPHKVIYNVA